MLGCQLVGAVVDYDYCLDIKPYPTLFGLISQIKEDNSLQIMLLMGGN